MHFVKRLAVVCAVLGLMILPSARGLAVSCATDYDCACGQVCNFPGGDASGLCVQADQSQGHCTGTEGPLGNGCLYQDQTCAASSGFCTPAWSQSSVCDQTTGTTGTTGSSTSGTSAASASGAGTGGSSAAGSSSGSSTTSSAGSSGGNGSSTGAGGNGTAGSTSGSSAPVSCVSDLDCPCGAICASGYHNDGHDSFAVNTCIPADGGQIGDTGLCALIDAGGTVEGSCHYAGQNCEFNIPITNIPGDFPPYCQPSWSPSSVCLGDGGTSPSKKSGCNTGVSGGTSLILALVAFGSWASRRRRAT
jgi:Cys-rich repeat protein